MTEPATGTDPQTGHTPGGVRAVALLETGKGILALLAASGVLSVMHEGTQLAVEHVVARLHLNPAHGYPRVLIAAAADLTEPRLVLLAAGVLLYAAIRFVEAWGLWFGRRWAEWFAALSGAVYIPFELWEIADGLSSIGLVVLGINLLIVGYMSLVLVRGRAARASASRREYTGHPEARSTGSNPWETR